MAEHFLVDTNVLVRFITGQPPEMAAKARRLIESADRGDVVIEVLPVVVAETVYTLESFYEMERKDVAKTLSHFLRSRGIWPHEKERVLNTLQRFHDQNVGFADAYLAAGGAETGLRIASFDRDFEKFKDINRYEPS